MANLNESNTIVIQNSDCSYFEHPDEQQRQALEFIARKIQSPNIFRISGHVRDEDYEPLVCFDSKRGKWLTGRYIGSAQFVDGNNKYELTIQPRFGKSVLYQMLAEIFDIHNIRFSHEARSIKRDSDKLYYLKILVSYLWLNMLAKANRHGLPRTNTEQRQQSSSLKGRLVVSASLVPLYTSDTVVSETRYKQNDQIIVRLLYQAYSILKREYNLGTLNVPHNAQEAIKLIMTNIKDFGMVTEKEYRTIRYHPIYENYRPIADFSWQIIKGKYQISQDPAQDSQTMGFFLDMAEIWECYVQKIISKHLSRYGWRLRDNEFTVYPSMFFQRRLIPDIVLQRDNCYLVFDAKWKRMAYRSIDVDRSDFFQIHTYISHLQTLGRVIMAGLIYPIEETIDGMAVNNYSSSLYNVPSAPTAFIVGGPVIAKEIIDFNPLWKRVELVAHEPFGQHAIGD